MKDPLSYTYDGLERELNLLEIHLKEAPEGDEAFCQDCINKHISTCRGYAIEGPGFTDDEEEQKRFLDAEKKLREIKGQNYKQKGVELAQKVRTIRKNLYDKCPECNEIFGESKVTIMKNITKNLNTPLTFNNQINQQSEQMVSYKEIGIMSAGQFAAEGGRYLAEKYPSTEPGKYEKYITIGGGAALTLAPMFVKKLNPMIKQLAMIAGTNLLAGGVVKWVKETTTTAAAFRAPGVARVAMNNAGYAGKFANGGYAPVAGGPTFRGRVTAKNIPTQYTRAGILSGSQAFEAPEHADLIRVD